MRVISTIRNADVMTVTDRFGLVDVFSISNTERKLKSNLLHRNRAAMLFITISFRSEEQANTKWRELDEVNHCEASNYN